MLIVASLGHETVADMVAAARASANHADLVELRLDKLQAPSEEALRELLESSPLPAIVTARDPAEGGAGMLDRATRERLLEAAIRHKAFAIDVELASPFRGRIVSQASEAGTHVVISAHDLAGTPPAETIVEALREARNAGAWVAKYAVFLRDADDAAELLRAALMAREEAMSFSLMAVNDAILRGLGPAVGMALGYARADDAPATAPGQMRVRDLALIGSHLPTPDATTKAVFLFGDPVTHSVSPVFMNAAFRSDLVNAVYLAARIPVERVEAAVTMLPTIGALGANVTMPLKDAVLPFCDALTDDVRATGAANVLVVEEGAVIAHNTDGAGACAALEEAAVRLPGARVLLLGAGGAARAVGFALAQKGARITIANRTPAKPEAFAHHVSATVVGWDPRTLAEAIERNDIIVNATSVGLYGDTSPIDVAALAPKHALLDCVYFPGGTPLVRAAQARGLRAVVPGEAMLLQQGALAYTLWTHRPAPVGVMRAALAQAMTGAHRHASPPGPSRAPRAPAPGGTR
ncbi:MAG: shikimate dehydrogenase [Thermoplasmatota archaeon]